MIDYNKIPEHMKESINGYVNEGWHIGSFLTAVFANDLFGAIGRGDEENIRLLRTYASYIHWELPSECHGSYEKVKNWQEKKRLQAAR